MTSAKHSHVAPGQAVKLELEKAGTFNAQVDAVLEDRLLLIPLAKLPVARHRIVGLAADAFVATPRGMWRAAGVITSCDDAERIEIGFAESPVVDQRREHVRIDTRLPGLIVTNEGHQSALHTFTLDISGGGILVAGAGTEPIGTPVRLQIKLPDRVLETDAKIARRTAEGHVGITFEGMSEGQREALVRWIFERQRLARQAERRREG